MNKFSILTFALITTSFAFQSCDLDDDDCCVVGSRPTALVTVRPVDDKSFVLQLDNKTTLYPSNMTASPFGSKEVRALVNYNEELTSDSRQNVHINWIDSIRTKMPALSFGDENDTKYGKDPIEIIKDWVTVAEDGYITLRIRTLWGNSQKVHFINLVSGVNASNPYEFELRHNAQGDTNGYMGDALIAFNLNQLLPAGTDNVKIKLNWNSFSGKKSTEFDLQSHQTTGQSNLEKIKFRSNLK